MISQKTSQFIEKARLIHGDKYDYSKVEYITSREKVIIICKTHEYEFLQAPYNHLSGRGCMKCGIHNKSNTQDFIEKAKLIHGEKYDYSKVEYIKNHKKVIIICKTHEYEFLQAPSNHLIGHGCMKCGIHNKQTTNEFIEKAKLIHGDKYNYYKVDYINTNVKFMNVNSCNNQKVI